MYVSMTGHVGATICDGTESVYRRVVKHARLLGKFHAHTFDQSDPPQGGVFTGFDRIRFGCDTDKS